MSGANQRFRDRRVGDPLIAERDWMPVIDALKRLSQSGLAGSVLYNSTGIYIRENNSIIKILSSIESSKLRVAKTTAAHNKGVAQLVDIYSGAVQGSETATGEQVLAYNRYADLEIDKWCTVAVVDGQDELIDGEC